MRALLLAFCLLLRFAAHALADKAKDAAHAVADKAKDVRDAVKKKLS